MYEMGDFAMLAAIIFAGFGIYMAHTLYKSPRKRWQCIAAWTAIILASTAVGEVLNVLLPQYVEQRISIFVGCSFVLVYLYLFPNIPMPQRIFTYFMVDNAMYLIVLLSRIATQMFVYYLHVNAQITCAVIYLFLMVAFWLLYRRWLRQYILQALAVFQKNLTSLTIFAVTCYLSVLFLVDVWNPWPALSVWDALPYFAIAIINLGGYALAFRTLTAMSERMTAESQAKLVAVQLGLAEKEYHLSMENIDQVRRMRHDMNHHLSALSALISAGEKSEALTYIEKATDLIPQKTISSGNFITDSFIDHYRTMCEDEHISFDAHIEYKENNFENKVHLGILLGNSLQNAFDAARKAKGAQRFISVDGTRAQDNLVLVIKNGVKEAPLPTLPSTKGEGHGLGLASMHGVVNEYRGYLDTTCEDNIFTLRVVLPLALDGAREAVRA